MRYIKVFYRLITWDNDKSSGSCYVFTSNPGFSASANAGSGSQRFAVTVRSSKSSSSVEDSVTMWLSDEDRKSLTPEEAGLYRDVFGSQCYLAVSPDNSMELMSNKDFAALPADEQTVVSSLFAS